MTVDKHLNNSTFKPHIWAVICGAIRNKFELGTTISRLCDMRQQGQIDGIAISTWKGEVDRIDGLDESLVRLGVEVIESNPLNDSNPYANLNYLRQSTQMKAALAVLPRNAVILKCRTDYSNFDLNRMDVNLIKGGIAKKETFGEFDSGLNHKLAVLRCGVNCPFTFHDITYAAVASDLRKISTTDNCILSVGMDVWPDVWLFAPYFVQRYPIFEDFFKYINHYVFTVGMMRLAETSLELILPNALNKFYALYFVVLYQSFCVYKEEGAFSDEADKLSFKDIFVGNRERGLWRNEWLVEIRNTRVLKDIVFGNVKESPGYSKLYSEIEKIKKVGYGESLEFSKDDYEELISWGRDYMRMEPKEWLRSFRKLDFDEENRKLGFEDALEDMFGEYSLDDELTDALDDISHNPNSYYGTIKNKLTLFKERDYNLYKSALLTSSRYGDDEVLMAISELLLEGGLTKAEEAEALYPFDRYYKEERLYEPMTEKRKKALLNYCKYEEEIRHESKVKKELVKRYEHFFDI